MTSDTILLLPDSLSHEQACCVLPSVMLMRRTQDADSVLWGENQRVLEGCQVSPPQLIDGKLCSICKAAVQLDNLNAGDNLITKPPKGSKR
jgi:hypothetical protein